MVPVVATRGSTLLKKKKTRTLTRSIRWPTAEQNGIEQKTKKRKRKASNNDDLTLESNGSSQLGKNPIVSCKLTTMVAVVIIIRRVWPCTAALQVATMEPNSWVSHETWTTAAMIIITSSTIIIISCLGKAEEREQDKTLTLTASAAAYYLLPTTYYPSLPLKCNYRN